MVKGSGSAEAVKAVYIKQEPTNEEAPSDPKEPGFMLSSQQIKAEQEFERLEPVLVKQERMREDCDWSGERETLWCDKGGGPDPKPPMGEAIVKVEPATDVQPLKHCSEGDGDATVAQSDKETKPYACEICGQKFKEIYFYVPHMQLHEHNIEIVEKSVTKQTTFRCDTCDKEYINKSGLYQHQQKHSCARFSCKHCDKKFTKLYSLNKHENSHTKPHECDMCDKRCARGSDLAKHKMRKHTGKKPHICEVCKKQFRCTSHLITHRNSHLCIKRAKLLFAEHFSYFLPPVSKSTKN